MFANSILLKLISKIMILPLAFAIISVGCCGSQAALQPTLQPTETNACTLTILTPKAGSPLPASGPIVFTWTSIPNAFYLFKITSPNNVSVGDWSVHTNTRTVMAESLGDPGTYTFLVQARDNNSDILCQASLSLSPLQTESLTIHNPTPAAPTEAPKPIPLVQPTAGPKPQPTQRLEPLIPLLPILLPTATNTQVVLK